MLQILNHSFVIHGNAISRLSRTKEIQTDKLLLKTPFEILNSLPNEQLVALQGETRVSVLKVPLSLSQACPLLLPIGSDIYTQSRILKIDWHPASQVHLYVLSSDGLLRLFNVSANTNEPELTLNLTTRSQKVNNVSSGLNRRGMFSSDDLEREVVSFVTGKGPGWTQFTVYGILKSGAIVSVCPVMPVSRYRFLSEKHSSPAP